MCGFEGVGLSGVQLSISELSVVGGWWWVGGGWVGGGLDKRTSWSDLVGVRQKIILQISGLLTAYNLHEI